MARATTVALAAAATLLLLAIAVVLFGSSTLSRSLGADEGDDGPHRRENFVFERVRIPLAAHLSTTHAAP